MLDLNREEMLYGAFFGASLFFWSGFWAIPAAVICAAFWALGGAPNLSAGWRRLGCPIVQAGTLYAATRYPWVVVSVLPAFGFLSLGYGIPSTQPYDEGSTLGKFFSRSVGTGFMANVLTRGTILLGLWLSFAVPMLLR